MRSRLRRELQTMGERSMPNCRDVSAREITVRLEAQQANVRILLLLLIASLA